MEKLSTEHLGDVQQTLLVPLYGRALESRRKNGLIKDPKAEHIVSQLDFDFSQLEDMRGVLKATTLRTRIYDALLHEIIERHPQATLIELGCGLNSRYERIHAPQVQWYDLDLPDVYDLWASFFEETPRRKFLPYSAYDPSWLDCIPEDTPQPLIFVAEASLLFFPKHMNLALLERLRERFPGAYYLFDTSGNLNAHNSHKGDPIQLFQASIQWEMPDVQAAFEDQERMSILYHFNFHSAPPQIKRIIPTTWKWMGTWLDKKWGHLTQNYFLNLIQLS